MRGDKLIIEEGHISAARQIMKLLSPQIMKGQSNFIITIAGESGSGKSEIAASLSELFFENSINKSNAFYLLFIIFGHEPEFMKPFVNILFSFLYIAAIVGLPVEVHYCHGDPVSVGLISVDEGSCCQEKTGIQDCCTFEMQGKTCSLNAESNCCSDEHYSVQYFEDKQLTNNTTISFRTGMDHRSILSIRVSEPEDDDSAIHFSLYDLPPPEPQPLWLLYCAFTFYG